MRVLIQRVIEARVSESKKLISEIGNGFLIFVCAMDGDHNLNAENMASKVSKLRIFSDENGKMNNSILDIKGEALIVSQFTLAADTSRGNRPGFSSALPPIEGERLYKQFVEKLIGLGVNCKMGVFGGDMKVSLVNDGPTTIWLDNTS